MRLINNLDHEIMYSLNENQYLHLKPEEFIFVPDTCRRLHIKPTDANYTLSIDQIMNFPRGEVKNIIVDKDIKSGYASNSIVVAENGKSTWFLNYLYTDVLGVGERVYLPPFDITKYDLEGKTIAIVDKEQMKKRLDKLTNDSSANIWWFILIIILIIVCVMPMCLYIYASMKNI